MLFPLEDLSIDMSHSRAILESFPCAKFHYDVGD